jgi:hypothetical protein
MSRSPDSSQRSFGSTAAVPGEGIPDEVTTRDLEETDADLESDQGDPVDFWAKKQRELVLSVVDYNLSSLAELVTNRTIDLSPGYQRRFRWDQKRQSRLIESFLMNVPVPSIYLNEDDYGEYSVIDGKQRITAISDFLGGRLELRGLDVFSELNAKTFLDLPSRLQKVLQTRPTLRAVIILRQSDDDVKFNVFQRLNTGGVRLNAQEIRNSTWPGALNSLILDLSESPGFHRLLGIKNKKKSAIFQEMRDAEFVLRFLAFRNTWPTFLGGMKRAMDRFMKENRSPADIEIEGSRVEFNRAVAAVDAAFGEHAFRRWVPEKKSWRRQVLASLFDAQMFACVGRTADSLRPHRARIVEKMQALFSDQQFRKTIDAATNTPSLFVERIKYVQGILP